MQHNIPLLDGSRGKAHSTDLISASLTQKGQYCSARTSQERYQNLSPMQRQDMEFGTDLNSATAKHDVVHLFKCQ